MGMLPLTQPIEIFMLVMIIILCAPIIFRRLKIPMIVGMILSGVAVGPNGFNLLARDASFEIFGQVGILYLMFMAAVEIDMYNLKRNYKQGGIFGILTFILPMAVGIPLTRYALDTGWDTAVLLSSMYASHTLISYPVVSRFGLSNNRGAVIAVCGTIVAVFLALVVLAEVVTVKVSGIFEISKLVKLLILTVIFSLVIGWLYPRLTRWWFKKTSDLVSQYILILTLVSVASVLAKLIGLEGILGAFYAGLVLNQFIPIRSALFKRTKFIGDAIFIPYFLIGVGMLLNVGVVIKGWGILTAALVMTGTALVTKYAACWITQKAFSLGGDERRLMFGLSSGKAAATIAATMIGYQYGLLSEDMMNGAVVMILICCIVASVVTENSAKQIRIRLTAAELEAESPRAAGFARQIVAVSNPLTAEGIMKMAIFMRSPRNTEPITALYVRSNDDRAQMRMGREAMRSSMGVADLMDVECKELERFDLNIVMGISNLLKERDATEVVIGLHRRSKIADTFYGSMVDQLMNATDRMIIMSRCFIPVDTIGKIFVYVPRNAEYETGFPAWLARIGNMASQLGRKVIFIYSGETTGYIESLIEEGGYEFIRHYMRMDSWDDFIILSSQIEYEDLLVVVGARRGSVSYSGDTDSMMSYLSKHFTRHNIAIIIPSQFGAS